MVGNSEILNGTLFMSFLPQKVNFTQTVCSRHKSKEINRMNKTKNLFPDLETVSLFPYVPLHSRYRSAKNSNWKSLKWVEIQYSEYILRNFKSFPPPPN